MPFAQRQIVLTITLQAHQGLPAMNAPAETNPTFDSADGIGGNTVTITGGGDTGLRIAAKVANAGFPSFETAEVQIYNLPLDIMNKLNTLGTQFIQAVGANSITIAAGNVGDTPVTIFSGTITYAYVDFAGAPDVIFNITCQVWGIQSASPAPAIGYGGPRDVGTLLGNLAKQNGLKLVNQFPGGLTPSVYNPYLSGSYGDQVKMLCEHTNIAWNIDLVNNTLTIGPTLASLSQPGAAIPIIAPPPNGNMKGYPSYTQTGVKVSIEFTTEFQNGTTVQISGSQLTNANGMWIVNYVEHDIECQAPDGPWFTNIEVRSLNGPAPIVPAN